MGNFFKPLLLVAAFVNLVVGMFSGLGRLGWSMPMPETYAQHGGIMVGGFLGTLIALEKVIPLKKPILVVGPLLSAASIFAFGAEEFRMAAGMQVAAGLVFILVYATYLRQQYNLYLIMAMAGAVCWLIGTILLFRTQFYPLVFPWYMAFLLFTIVSERLELSRFLPVTASNRMLLFGFLILFMLGILLPFHGVGIFLVGAGLILISLWLIRYDVVRITVRKDGLVRFTAVALLCGYTALLIEGIFLLTVADLPFGYDMIVHTFFLGFVFSMIFAHGPIILPGVLGISVKPYHALLYVPVAILELSLVIRLLADVSLLPLEYRALSGWTAMGGILLYFALMATLTLMAVRLGKNGLQQHG